MLKQNLILKNKILILIFICSFSNIFLLAADKIDIENNIKKESNNLDIDSDILTINKTEGSAIFEGNVIIKSNIIMLYTTKAIVLYDKNTNMKNQLQISKVVIPNKLKIIKQDDDEILLADSGTYYVSEEKIVFIGNVVLMNQDSILQTKELVYHPIIKLNTP